MNIVDHAMLIALEAHAGDRNKHDGEMYNRHLARVWINVREAGGTEVQQAIAWLHDSLEDTTLTLSSLSQKLSVVWANDDDIHLQTTEAVKAGVSAITKVEGEADEDYYQRVKLNPDARFVKYRGDIMDNFSRNWKIESDVKRLKFAKRYSMGVDILK